MLRKITPFLTPVLLILAFPNFQISILAWIAFIPLLFAIDGESGRRSFCLSYIAGLIFFSGTLYWLTFVTKLGFFVLIFYLALYFGAFGLLANSLLNKLRTSKLNFLSFLVLPSLWVSLEFLRGILLTGFPWAILGYTQYKNPVIIQIADITGSYGVSFLIMMVNCVIYFHLSGVFKKITATRVLKLQTLASLLIIAGVVSYGYYAVNIGDVETGIKLSVVQGNIAQEEKWDPAYKDYILEKYEKLVQEAAKDEADLIVWPETSVPGYLDEKHINKWLGKIINNTGVPQLLGVVIYEQDTEGDRFFNTAALFKPVPPPGRDWSIEREYHKIYLVPLGEYVPFEEHFPFVRDFVNVQIGDFTPGEEFTLFDISKGGVDFKYAALICFEDIFPGLVRRFALDGADLFINMTNDAWFKKSSEQLQHAQASVFRAVENRVSVLRAANTGFSCYINPRGIIEGSIYDEETGSMYIAGHKTFELKISNKNPFYARFGDLFTYLCIIGTVLALNLDRFRR